MKTRLPILLLSATLLIYEAVLFFGVAKRAEDPPSPQALDSSRRCPRRPFEATDPLALPPRATPQDLNAVAEAIALVHQASERSRLGCGNIYFGGGRFLRERDFHHREWRLLAQAYPAAAECIAEELLGHRPSTRERHTALKVLSQIAKGGGRRAEHLLFRNLLSWPAGAMEAHDPLYSLSAADPDRLYQDTYRLVWSGGRIWARDLLDYVVDAKAIDLLRKISMNPADPDYLREDVDIALMHLRILEGNGLQERLTGIFEQAPSREDRVKEDRRAMECRWALEIVRSRHLDLRNILRRILDRNFVVARRDLEDEPNFPEYYRQDVHVFPRDWDDTLVTYVEMGGTPNALERDRLREFGYLCDPKERLTELLRALH